MDQTSDARRVERTRPTAARLTGRKRGAGKWVLLLLIATAVGAGAYFLNERERFGFPRDVVGTTGRGPDVTTVAAILDSPEAMVGRTVRLSDVTVADVSGDQTVQIQDAAGATIVGLIGAGGEGEPLNRTLQTYEGQQLAIDGIVRRGGRAAARNLQNGAAEAVANVPVYLEVTGAQP